MRKFLYLIVFVMFASANAQAQSLNDLFRSLIGGSAEESEPAKVVFPSEDELLGGWVYKSLDMEYGGSDVLASMAVAAAKTQLESVAAKFGVTPNSATTPRVSVERRKITMHRGEQKADAKYTYIPSNGQMIVTAEYNKERYILTAWVSQRDGGIAVMFSAVELVAIASRTKQYQENATLQALGEMVKSYPEIRVGAIFGR